ncbi:MAG: tetratricopeptide repeat protein [Anaerolineales bacterium]|nr:tetratricopeptide repeat protein [Anaerolineales bacterium]
MITVETQEKILSLKVAIANHPADSALYVDLGFAHFEAEQFEVALAAFRQALALNPAAAAAHNGSGRVYERLGDAQAALGAYNEAIALDPTKIPPYIGLGIIYLDQLGNYEAAATAFGNGLMYHPDDPFALALLGNTYAHMGRFEDAIQMFQRAIHLEPTHDFALSNLSLVYLHLGQWAKMIDSCQRELAIADDAEPRRLLGYVYNRLGQYEDAVAQLERSVALNPADYEARGALSRVYRKLGRDSAADAQYTQANALAAQDNEYGQACFAAVTDDLEKALTLLAIALTKGQVRPAWVRIDPEFAFIQAEARFQALLTGS